MTLINKSFYISSSQSVYNNYPNNQISNKKASNYSKTSIVLLFIFVFLISLLLIDLIGIKLLRNLKKSHTIFRCSKCTNYYTIKKDKKCQCYKDKKFEFMYSTIANLFVENRAFEEKTINFKNSYILYFFIIFFISIFCTLITCWILGILNSDDLKNWMKIFFDFFAQIFLIIIHNKSRKPDTYIEDKSHNYIDNSTNIDNSNNSTNIDNSNNSTNIDNSKNFTTNNYRQNKYKFTKKDQKNQYNYNMRR